MLMIMCVSIIPQRYSWGELQVTRDLFQRILTHLNVSESLLHVAIEFGSKVNHDLPRSSTTSFVGRAHCSSSIVPGNAIEHPENHGMSIREQIVHRLRLEQKPHISSNTSRGTVEIAVTPGLSVRPESTLKRVTARITRAGFSFTWLNRLGHF